MKIHRGAQHERTLAGMTQRRPPAGRPPFLGASMPRIREYLAWAGITPASYAMRERVDWRSVGTHQFAIREHDCQLPVEVDGACLYLAHIHRPQRCGGV